MPIDRRWLPKISERIKQYWHPRRRDRSAGGVPYRRVANATAGRRSYDAVEVALIATHGGRRWQLPKGTQEAGESTLQTALREVEEEAGLRTHPERFLKTVEYWYWDTFGKEVPHLVHKQVDFYLLRTVDGTLTDASHEVDAVGWFPPEEALQTLTFAAERAVLQAAIEHFEQAPPEAE